MTKNIRISYEEWRSIERFLHMHSTTLLFDSSLTKDRQTVSDDFENEIRALLCVKKKIIKLWSLH
jgi:hypothetical protein